MRRADRRSGRGNRVQLSANHTGAPGVGGKVRQVRIILDGVPAQVRGEVGAACVGKLDDGRNVAQRLRRRRVVDEVWDVGAGQTVLTVAA